MLYFNMNKFAFKNIIYWGTNFLKIRLKSKNCPKVQIVYNGLQEEPEQLIFKQNSEYSLFCFLKIKELDYCQKEYNLCCLLDVRLRSKFIFLFLCFM